MIDTLSLEAEPGSARRARQFVTRHLAGREPVLIDNATLMVSELVTNSIRHASGACVVTLELTLEMLRIKVSDAGPATPVVRSPSPDEPTGRGLRIVAQLASDWGIDATPGSGNTVWFCMDLTAAPTTRRVRVSPS